MAIARKEIIELYQFGKSLVSITRYATMIVIISSPEPKAHGELIVYQSSWRPSVRASVRPSVNIFKH